MKLKPRFTAILATVGLVALVVGSGLVISGEVQRIRGDQRFRSAQVALKQGIELFDDSANQVGDSDNSAAPGSEDSGPRPDLSADVSAIARVRIPSIGVDAATLEFKSSTDLEFGLAWMPESARLGTTGTSVVVGHRTLFGAPLREADQIAGGDKIVVTSIGGTTATYSVRSIHYRRPTESYADLVADAGATRLLLVTCHPEYSTEFRLLVVADADVDAQG